MDGWMCTLVHGHQPSLWIVRWPPIPPQSHTGNALGRVIPAKNPNRSCKYSTGVNLAVLVCQWCNCYCQLKKAPPTTIFRLYNMYLGKYTWGKIPKPMDLREIFQKKCTELNTYMFLRKQHRQSTYENSTAAFHAFKMSQVFKQSKLNKLSHGSHLSANS